MRGADVVAIIFNAVITSSYVLVNRAQAIGAYEARRKKVEANCKILSYVWSHTPPAFTTQRGLCDCTRTLQRRSAVVTPDRMNEQVRRADERQPAESAKMSIIEGLREAA